MSPFKFVRRIDEGKVLEVYGDGNQKRDFTYVDDIACATIRALAKTGFHIINIGNNRPEKLRVLIHYIEKYTGKKAKIKYLPHHEADMKSTWADISLARKHLHWKPKTNLENGVRNTVTWYQQNKRWISKLKG